MIRTNPVPESGANIDPPKASGARPGAERLVLSLVVAICILALAMAWFTPSFQVDPGLVYAKF